MQQKEKRFRMFLHLYVFYMCDTYHCIFEEAVLKWYVPWWVP